MRPFKAFKEYLRKRGMTEAQLTEEQQLEARVAAFIDEIDTRVRVFGLDPSLTEIADLKAQAAEILNDSTSNLFLMWLNPYREVEFGGDHLVIHERMFGHVLQSWSLVEFHLEDYEIEDFKRIRVDDTGTHVYGRRDNEHVHYHSGVLNPHRAADPGNRVRCAVGFVNYFTGLELEWTELHKYHWAEFTKGPDGTWTATYDPEPAYT